MYESRSYPPPALGFGRIAPYQRFINIRMIEGELPIEKLHLSIGSEVNSIEWEVTTRPNAAAVLPS
jgi:hypothetical protein